MKKIMFCRFSMALACLTTFASTLPAAIMVSSSTDVAPGGGAVHDVYVPTLFSASGSDLAEGVLATHDASDTNELSAGASVWTDGSLATVYGENGSGGDAVDHAAYGTVQSANTITFDLGALHDLAQVDVYTGWNDSGRDAISFMLSVSADDVSYTTLATYLKGPDDTGAITTPVTNLHSIADDGGANLANGVQYVRLVTTDSDNGSAGIVEVDVFAAVPEPTSIAMALVGCATMLLRRRA